MALVIVCKLKLFKYQGFINKFFIFQFEDIKKFGCDISLCSACFKIYIELSEIKKYYGISYHFSEELKRPYLLVQKTNNSKPLIYIPFTEQKFSFSEISKYQIVFESKTIFLAVCDPGSAILYYGITKS